MDWKVNAEPVWYDSAEDDEWDSDSGIASGHTCSTPTDSMSPTDTGFSLDGAKLLSCSEDLWFDGKLAWMDCDGSSGVDGPTSEEGPYPGSEERCQQQEQMMVSLFSEHCIAVVKRLVQLLLDEDSQIVYKSALYLFDLSRTPANSHLIAQSADIFPALVTASKRRPLEDNPELGHCLCGFVHYLSQTDTGLDLIVQDPACVRLVVTYLHSSLDSILFYAVTALHNLLLYGSAAKDVVRADSSAAERLVALLQHTTNTKFLAVCTDCLQLLAYSNPNTKLVITRSGGVAAVVHILHTTEYEKLVWTSLRLLKVLSVCHDSKRAILDLGEVSMEALGRCLTPQSTPRLRLNALWTLRNLSDVAVQIVRTSQDLLERLILCVDEGGEASASCVVGILSNLTCRNQHNKTMLVQLGVVSALLRHISSLPLPLSTDFLEPALCCLRHVTAGHSLALSASLYITAERDRLETLTTCLQGQPASVRRVWLGLVRNLVFSLGESLGARVALARRNLVGEPAVVQTLADLLTGIVDRLAISEQELTITANSSDSKNNLVLLETYSQLLSGLHTWPQSVNLLTHLATLSPALYSTLFNHLLDSHYHPTSVTPSLQKPLLTLLQTLAAPASAITLLLTTIPETRLLQQLEAVNSSTSSPLSIWAISLLSTLSVELDMCRQLNKTSLLPALPSL